MRIRCCGRTALFFDAAPGQVASQLPRVLGHGDSLIRVVLAGPLTDMQRLAVQRRYVVRRARLRDLLGFLVRNNVQYAGVAVSDPAIDAAPVHAVPAGIIGSEAGADAGAAARVDADAASVSRPHVVVTDLQEDREADLMREDGSVFACDAAGTSDDMAQVVIYRRGPLLSSNDRSRFAKMYPVLFPFGRGHPGEERRVPVSESLCVKHYLRLATRRFAQHQTFVLVAFDQLARQRALQSSYVNVRWNRRLADAAAISSVSREQIAVALRHQDERRRALLRNQRVPETPSGMGAASTLMRGISFSARSMWGSNEERLQMRRRAFAMSAFFGNPHVFVTFSPNDVGNMCIAYIAGALQVERLLDVTQGDMITPAHSFAVAGSDSVACAEYFRVFVAVFFELIVGFDPHEKRPMARGGAFGHVQAYYGSVETQGRGGLHVHCLLWLTSMPKTSKDYDAVLQERGDELRQRLAAYTDSIATSSLPIGDLSPRACPRCVTGTLDRVEPVRAAFLAASRDDARAPVVAMCTSCMADLDADEIRESRLGAVGFHVDADLLRWASSMPAATVGLEDREQRRNVALAMMQRYQTHSWRHVASCFKASANATAGECRYRFPRDPVTETHVDDAGSIQLKRELDDVFFNTCTSRSMMEVLQCNHDVRLMLGCGATDAIYYTMKYSVKEQQRCDSRSAVALAAFDRRVQREGLALPTSDVTRSVGRISSMLYGISGKHEVSAPLAAYYLLGQEVFLPSHDFAPLNLSQALSMTGCDADLELTLQRSDDDSFTAVTQLHDYLFRPAFLDDVFLYEFVSRFRKEKLQDGVGDECRFTVLHPQVQSHQLVQRAVPVIPDVIGPALPDREVAETQARYATIAMLLLVPFRDLDCLGPEDGRTAVFLRHEERFGARQRDYLRFRQESYDGKRRGQEQRRARDDAAARATDGDVGHPPRLRMDFSSDENDDDRGDEVMLGIAAGADADGEPEPMHAATEARLSRATSHAFDQLQMAGAFARRDHVELPRVWPAGEDVYRIRLSAPDIGSAVARLIADAASTATAAESNDAAADRAEEGDHGHADVAATSATATVHLLDQAIASYSQPGRHEGDPGVGNDGNGDPVIGRNPSIADISTAFTLNQLQHAAFAVVARDLLRSFRCDQLDDAPGRPELRMMLSGEGGTGKSRVIHAIRALADAWSRPGAVRIASFTGLAAVLVEGETLHRMFGLAVRGARAGRMSEQKKEAFARMRLLIIDEISMVSTRMLSRVNAQLQLLMSDSRPFGGVLMLFCGDFMQLPPVGGKALYSRDLLGTSGEVDDVAGRLLWRNSLTSVIVLKDNMRALADRDYAVVLDRVRQGCWDERVMSILNSRVTTGASFVLPDDHPVIVGTNQLRTLINRSVVLSAGDDPILIRAELQPGPRSREPTDAERHYIYSMSDDRTGRLLTSLIVCRGMRVMVTQNVATQLGIANGSMGVVEGLQFAPGTTFTSLQLHDRTVQVASALPDLVLVNIPGSARRRSGRPVPGMPQDAPVDVFPMFPAQVSESIEMPGRYKLSVKIRQIPIVPAYSLTVYKTQGLTLLGAVLARLRGAGVRPMPQGAYVALSRVRRLQTLQLLQPFDRTDAEFFRPGAALAAEMTRLEEMHYGTIRSME